MSDIISRAYRDGSITNGVGKSTASAGYDGKLYQTIYAHGGSRIWIEKDGKRILIAETFNDPDLAVSLFHFISDWMNRKKS